MINRRIGEEKDSALEKAYGVFQENIDSLWPKLLPFVTRVLSRDSEFTPEQIYNKVKNYESQLMVGERSGVPEFILVTSIYGQGKDKSCLLFLAAGENGKHWISYLGSVESWAKAQGCKTIKLQGRPGWKKWLKEYRVKDVILEKRLTEVPWADSQRM